MTDSKDITDDSSTNNNNDNNNNIPQDSNATDDFVPKIVIPPKPSLPNVEDLPYGPNDVLSGRGTLANVHSGNVAFRQLVASNQTTYINAVRRAHKAAIAQAILAAVAVQSGPTFSRPELAQALGTLAQKNQTIKVSAMYELVHTNYFLSEGARDEEAARVELPCNKRERHD